MKTLQFTGGAVVLLRHALAGAKLADAALDAVRPLDADGQATSLALPEALREHLEVTRILSSPLQRCVETVEPLARAHRLSVARRTALRPDATRDEALACLLAAPAGTVACTHGELIDALLPAIRCEKGAFLVIAREAGSLVPVRYVAPPLVRVAVGAG